jgi:hypothetical protein
MPAPKPLDPRQCTLLLFYSFHVKFLNSMRSSLVRPCCSNPSPIVAILITPETSRQNTNRPLDTAGVHATNALAIQSVSDSPQEIQVLKRPGT